MVEPAPAPTSRKGPDVTTAPSDRTEGAGRPLVVVMGVSGSGKTTVGVPLAARLEVEYGEADDFHPQRNIDKMAAGDALDDEDREPWLQAIGRWLAERTDDGAVVTCSALARRYRDTLRSAAPEAVFLHLAVDGEVLKQRMAERQGHFMPASLLESQLAALEPLEPDESGLTVDADAPVDALLDSFDRWWDDGRPTAATAAVRPS
ncbi:MAG: Gluconokinase [uncultured Nocardioidaceae bacterium]|uniref:Gluconokinase n=1 Tax=uncultured Nocardioidaceae bacterium TaxID=253824 RepID=A0A6J4M5C1_9ACTN|nr:MAG: Gluconokinase [uncultured Nocardioidaceae bacterium]